MEKHLSEYQPGDAVLVRAVVTPYPSEAGIVLQVGRTFFALSPSMHAEPGTDRSVPGDHPY
jgi:hypothetical protein